jgi:hypothetical protein
MLAFRVLARDLEFLKDSTPVARAIMEIEAGAAGRMVLSSMQSPAELAGAAAVTVLMQSRMGC